MKKVNDTIKSSLRKNDPTSNNTNTNNRPYRKQITTKKLFSIQKSLNLITQMNPHIRIITTTHHVNQIKRRQA